jgi:hypothetical protein
MKSTPSGFGYNKSPSLEALRNRLMISGLNQGQTDALMLMFGFLETKGDDIFVLKGYAGTGKTYLVKRFVEHICAKFPYRKIAITAPTNKAVQVLLSKREFKGRNVQYQTIHSLLGLTEVITKDGKVVFTNKGKDNGQLSKMDYLIVDEVSMLQDDIFDMLAKYADKVKMIFMGDPAQIPPVGKVNCIPFERSLSKTLEEGYTLTEIMRQTEGNPIVKASFTIRDNLFLDNPIPKVQTIRDDKGHGIIYLDPITQRDEFLYQLESHFTSSEFKKDPDFAKVIAWRNKTVHAVNSHIRRTIFGEDIVKIMSGEKLLANKPIFDGEGGILFNTSEEFTVDTVNVETKKLSFGGEQISVKVYNCLVDPHDKTNHKGSERIRVLHEESEKPYQEMLERLKERAVKISGANQSWVKYYDAVKWPADIVYNYAITAHKAQGSTYRNVFLMEDDINANPNVVERNRIKYTSYSRASHNLYIYRRN